MKPMSAKDKQLLVILLALIIISASYFFGARVLMDKTTELETKQTEMRGELDQRLQVIAKQDEYEQKTEEYNTAYDEMMRSFPAGISQDDQLMFAQDLQTMYDSPIESVSFTEPAEVLALTTAAQDGTAYSLQSSTLQIPMELAYAEWVDVINYLGTQARGRNVLTTVEGAYDPETDKVKTTITMNQYAITGSDRTFVPESGNSPLGTTNIFTTSAPVIIPSEKNNAEFAEIRDSYNMSLSLYPHTQDTDNIAIENADQTVAGSTVSDAMDSLNIEIADSEDSSTSVTFQLSDNEPQTITGITDDSIKFYVFSSERNDEEDLSGVNVVINNKSDKAFRIAVENDDPVQPRFHILSQDGKVSVISK